MGGVSDLAYDIALSFDADTQAWSIDRTFDEICIAAKSHKLIRIFNGDASEAEDVLYFSSVAYIGEFASAMFYNLEGKDITVNPDNTLTGSYLV